MHNNCLEILSLTCNFSIVCQSHTAAIIICYSSYNSSTSVTVTAENNKGIDSPTTGYNSEKSSHSILINRVLPELEKTYPCYTFQRLLLTADIKVKTIAIYLKLIVVIGQSGVQFNLLSYL